MIIIIVGMRSAELIERVELLSSPGHARLVVVAVAEILCTLVHHQVLLYARFLRQAFSGGARGLEVLVGRNQACSHACATMP